MMEKKKTEGVLASRVDVSFLYCFFLFLLVLFYLFP